MAIFERIVGGIKIEYRGGHSTCRFGVPACRTLTKYGFDVNAVRKLAVGTRFTTKGVI